MFLLKPYLHYLGWSQGVRVKYRGKPGPKSFIQTIFHAVLFAQPRPLLMMMRVKMKITMKTVLLMMRVRRRRWMKTRTTCPNQTTVAKRMLNVCRKKQKRSSGGRSDFCSGYFPWKQLLHTNLTTTIKHLILSKEAFYKVLVLDYFHDLLPSLFKE